jgi:hypothetical protein
MTDRPKKVETPEEKFTRLANARVNRAIRTIRLIGNLANRSSYGYKDEHVKEIFRALDDETRRARDRFNKKKDGRSEDFRLEA